MLGMADRDIEERKEKEHKRERNIVLEEETYEKHKRETNMEGGIMQEEHYQRNTGNNSGK